MLSSVFVAASDSPHSGFCIRPMKKGLIIFAMSGIFLFYSIAGILKSLKVWVVLPLFSVLPNSRVSWNSSDSPVGEAAHWHVVAVRSTSEGRQVIEILVYLVAPGLIVGQPYLNIPCHFNPILTLSVSYPCIWH